MNMESQSEKQVRSTKILRALHQAYPTSECALFHDTPLQLLIATILSAQCTDKRVNMVTPALFARFPDAAALAEAHPSEVAELVRSTGFYQNKTKNIIACCQAIMSEHGGQVPQSMEALIKLPGVGRKTANVVLGTAWGIASGVVVDTHVKRITNLLQLTAEAHPEKIETDLNALLPREEWIAFSHMLIWHGRQVCIARRPQCAGCVLKGLCPSANES
jgi:endonuclease III